MIQVDTVGYPKVKDDPNADEDMKENGYIDQENTIARPSVKLLTKMSEEFAEKDCDKREKLNDHHHHLVMRHQEHNRDEIVHNEDNLSDEDNNDKDSGAREEDEDKRSVFPHDRSSTPHGSTAEEPSAPGSTAAAAVAIAAAAAAVAAKSPVGASSSLPNDFNPVAFFPPPGQMSIQAFQNAIAQFTANALANNMDNEAMVKNLAILQSALFTLQQQQFLQFQLIQHLQSQLVRKQTLKEEPMGDSSNHSILNHNNNNNNNNNNEHSKRAEPQDLRKPERQEEEDDIEEEGIEDAYSKSYQMAAVAAAAAAAAASAENRPIIHPISEEELRKPKVADSFVDKRPMLDSSITLPSSVAVSSASSSLTTPSISSTARSGMSDKDEILPYQDSNFSSLAANIITDHAPLMMGEPNSLAMLEKKAQEVLNSASQGILSNNLLDELAFANDKSSPNGRSDAALFKHRCRYCGKIFGSDSSLQIHIRSHTGERPYKCNICGSRFTTKGNLKVHFQRHSDKYPHIPMNPNPVPEHLDKYFPPLIPQEALKEQQQQQQQQHQSQPAPGSIPPPGPPPPQFSPLDSRPFPPRGFFSDFYMPRPPLDMFNNALSEPARNPVDLSQVRKPDPPREPTPEMRLSPVVVIHESPHTIKQEPMEQSLDLSEKSSKNLPKPEEKEEVEQEKELNNSTNSERDYPLKLKNNSVENLATVPSVSPPSSSSSGSLYQDTVLDPSFYSAHLPRPDSNDSSWENFIEISSETSKLQELVDNLDSKNTEPNQCLVCKKVLSCRSALQMHYRVHTGERPFRCKICGRSFTTKGNLKTHMSVHRIKPPMRTLHQCPVCHQKFSNIFVLQQHIRLHTGEMTDLTPDQIKAAEIKEFEGHDMRINPFGLRLVEFPQQNQNKRMLEHSDEENEQEASEGKSSPKVTMPIDDKSTVKAGLASPAIESQVEDLRAMNLQRLSVRSLPNEDFSRDSASASPNSSDAKRLRPSSPIGSVSSIMSTRSPMSTPPTTGNDQLGALSRAAAVAFPYGPPFLGMPQFPPFINRPPFLGNVPIVPPGSNMPPFGLFGVRGNTTTCNICFKTFACNSALEIHYRSHTKERPFKCTICDRGFSTKGNMKQHMLTHKIRDMFGNSVGNSGDESRTQTPPQDSNVSGNAPGGGSGGVGLGLGSTTSSNRFGLSHSPASSMDTGDDYSSPYPGERQHERPLSSSYDGLPTAMVKQERELVINEHSSNGLHLSTTENTSNNNYQQYTNKDVDIKNWCQKLKEMPENIAAS